MLADQRANQVIDLTPRQRYLIVDTIGITTFKDNAFAIVIFAVTSERATAPAIFVFQKFNAFFLRMLFGIKLGNTFFTVLDTASAAN